MSPTIRNKTHYFHKSVYQNSTLYIPNGTISDFETADVWKNFQNIQMYDPDDPSLGITNTISNKPITIVNGKNILLKKLKHLILLYIHLTGELYIRVSQIALRCRQQGSILFALAIMPQKSS